MSVIVISGNDKFVIATGVSLQVAREIKQQVINCATFFVVVRIVVCTK